MNLESVGRFLLVAGLVIVVLGGALLFAKRLGIGRLPGDLVWRGDKVTLYFPLGLSILASIILTIVLNLFLRR